MELKDFLSSENIELYIKELPAEDTIEQVLFPSKLVNTTKLERARGAKRKSVALMQSTFDVAAKIRALSADLTVESMDMPYFKESMAMDETTRRELISAIGSNNQNLVQALLGQVFENYADLYKSAKIVEKMMRSAVLQNGYVNFLNGDKNIVMDYGVPTNHRETITTSSSKWNNAAADIIGDIKRYIKVLTDGDYAKPNTILMTEQTFDSTFMINTAITAHIRNSNLNTNLILTQTDYLNFVNQFLGLRVIFLENKKYVPYQGAAEVSYYEDGKVTFINTSEPLGNLVCGQTPEGFDKLYGSGKLDCRLLDDNIALSTMVRDEPITVDTKISILCAIDFPKAEEVFYASVY